MFTSLYDFIYSYVLITIFKNSSIQFEVFQIILKDPPKPYFSMCQNRELTC